MKSSKSNTVKENVVMKLRPSKPNAIEVQLLLLTVNAKNSETIKIISLKYFPKSFLSDFLSATEKIKKCRSDWNSSAEEILNGNKIIFANKKVFGK